MKRIVFITLMSICVLATAQTKIKESEVPKAVLLALENTYTSYKVKSWFQNPGQYVAELVVDGQAGKSFFTDAGDWQYSSFPVTIAEMPTLVNTYFDNNYPGYRIKSSEYVEEMSGDNYYRLVIAMKGLGANDYELVFDTRGKLLKNNAPDPVVVKRDFNARQNPENGEIIDERDSNGESAKKSKKRRNKDSEVEQYKAQKVSNEINEKFLAQVDDWGKSYKYSRIQTRDNAIKSIPNRQSAFLYWIDAMGVEYLALIVELAKRKGLSIHVDIGRAELPSLTEFNKGFYENWDGIGKIKEDALDDIKHHDKGGFFFTSCEDPIHLESEIAVIERAINYAATKLAMRECKSFVIASDHGASRLAVLKRQEEKHSTETGGEHSGRCCKVFDGYDLPNCVEEKGYLVLTDYGRFKGGRAANVEVHGGASLEEVLVPIVTLSLKKQSVVDIRIINIDNIIADRKNGTTIQIYISDVDNQQKVSVVIGNDRYQCIRDDATHYTAIMPDIKRSKVCKAAVYDGDNLIGSVEFKIKGKSGNVNSGFDSEFDDF